MRKSGLNAQMVGAIALGKLETSDLRLATAKEILRHGLAGVAARLVPSDRPASDAEQMLLNGLRQQQFKSMQVAAALRQLEVILNSAEINFLFLKGPVLAAQAFNDWAARTSSDVDILIDEVDCTRLHEVMIKSGLVRQDGNRNSPSALRRWAHCEVGYTGLSVPIPVDAHWRLDAPSDMCLLPMPDLLDRADTVTVGPFNLRTLGRVDAWIFTAIHGTRSTWNGWKWFLDACRQSAALDPHEREAAYALARTAGPLPAVQLTEALVEAAGIHQEGAQIPDWARRRARRMLAESVGAGEVSLSPLAGLRRRIEMMTMTPTIRIAIDSFVRAMARFLMKLARIN